AEAATYGLALADRATWSVAGNAHLRSGARDDVEILALAGEATYDQYGTPFGGQTYGAFDGAQTAFPGEPSPGAPVLTPTRIRGAYAIEKIEDLRTYDQSYARLRLYRSQYGAQTNAPFFDDLSFPNGVISYAGRQSGVLTGFGFDVKTFAAERHRTAYGIELRRQTSSLDQSVPTLDERLTSDPVLTSALAYLSDEWTVSPSFTVQGALRAKATHVSRSDGGRYGIAALDPHVAAVYRFGGNALRLTFDHTTVAPKPLETERHSSTEVDAPFVPLAPERGDSYELSFERQVRGGALRLTFFAKAERDRIDVLPADFRSAGAGIGVPQSVGSLLANGAEIAFTRGPLSVVATSVHARSSSASQFALNDLNAPAIAANHLFPVGYIPDLSATATYRFHIGKLTIAPSLSYETGYPYGNGRSVWVSENGVPQRVLNDNHVNPGYNYYFLRDPSQPYDPATNPITGSLGTPEGDDPNTLRSTPLLLVSLHVEHPLSSRTSLALDVANLFGTATPTQLQSNPYLIGPPGYAGGDAAYAAWYGQKLAGKPYTLGNGIPTNDGQSAIVPWQYGTGGYVPASFPEARSISLSLRMSF
ncbi:MAG TPA: TonB-dependent receptor, partial [Candidatus Elarobacter sp.]